MTRQMRLRCLLPLLLLMTLPGVARADEAAEVQRLMRSGDLAAALQRAERATAAEPRNAKLRFLQGVILLDQKHDGPAMDVFQRLAEEFPELPEPYNNIALLHARAGRLEEARQALETALRNDPGMLAARQNLGDVLLRLALQAWQKVADATPADAALQRKLRMARELLGTPPLSR
jgi:Flp pilus assembly protein TadD